MVRKRTKKEYEKDPNNVPKSNVPSVLFTRPRKNYLSVPIISLFNPVVAKPLPKGKKATKEIIKLIKKCDSLFSICVAGFYISKL